MSAAASPGGPRGPEWALVLALALVLSSAFVVALYLDYGVGNDYKVFSYDRGHGLLGYPESQHLFWIGRPLGALLLNLQLSGVEQIGDFKRVRFAGFGLLLALFVAIFLQFRREVPGKGPHGAVTAFCVVLLPATLLYVFWVANAVPGTLNALLATVAHAAVFSGYGNTGARAWALPVLGYSLLAATFLIYPPTSYFFLAFTCWRAAMSDKLSERSWRGRTAAELAMTCVLSGAYLAALKVMATARFVGLFFAEVSPPIEGPYRTALAGDLGGRLGVAGEYVHRSAQLWLVDWSDLTAGAVGVAFVWLLVSGLRGASGDGGAWARWGRVLVPLAAMGISAAPMVAASGGFVAVRNVFAGSAVACIVLCSAVTTFFDARGQRTTGLLALGLLASLALFAATLRLSAAAFNASAELTYLRAKLSHATGVERAVVLHLPPAQATIVGRPLTSEFRYLATNCLPIEGLPCGVLEERGMDPGRSLVSFHREPSRVHVEGALEICMADAGFAQFSAAEAHCCRAAGPGEDRDDVWVGSPSRDVAPHGLARAFDGSVEVDSCWETACTSQVTLDVRYRSPRALPDYSFTSGPREADRMPACWEVFGSPDGALWQRLGPAVEAQRWAPDETREFELPSTERFRFYRFVFGRAGSAGLLRLYEVGLHDRVDGDVR